MKFDIKRSSALMAAIVAGSLLASNAGANPAGAQYYSSKDLRAIESPLPDYPRRAEKKAIEGYTLVEFTVMPDGTVAAPAVAESSNSLFGKAAVEAIESWKFEPVVDGEATVPVRSTLRFNFVGQVE
ncbi:MAG: energy transducer TonB [Pseudohongiellaceae bacterium]